MPGNEFMKKWRETVRTVPAQAVAVARSPLWQRRLAWAVGALLVLWALAYAAVPALVKWQMQSTVSTKLGRQVTVGAVDFKPWSLEMTVHDLAVARAGVPGDAQAMPQASPQFTVKRIYIDAELQSLLRLAPVADAIAVEAPVLSVAHLGEGRYDIDDILDRLKTPEEAPAGTPPRFALYNLVLTDGQIDFNDQPAGKAHALRDLDFSVPFLSNLRSKRDVTTAPRLAFKLNGSSFDTAALGTPFAQTRKLDATLAVRDLDLRPYLAYWPASLPFKLQNAIMHADVKVAFEQTPATSVRISGTVTADKVRLREVQGAGRELLDFERLQISMDDVRPLEQMVKLSAVELTAPTLHITRDRAGRLNLIPVAAQSATKNGATSARPQRAAGQKGLKDQASAAAGAASAPQAPAPAAASTPWKIQVARVAVRAGSVNWRDEALASPADIRLGGLVLDASAIALPFSASAPLKFTGSAGLAVPTVQTSPARLSFSGSATDRAAQVSASVADWPLAMAAKYVGEFLLPALQGRLDGQLAVDWRAAAGAAPQALQVTAPQISVSDVSLAQGNNALVSIQRVNLAQVAIDVPAQSFKAASLQLSQPKARVERGADQRWMYERWLVERKAAGAPPPAAARGGAAPSWAVAINEVQLEGGAVSFSDKAGAAPVAFEVTVAQAQLGALVLDDRFAGKTRATQWMPLTASLRLGTGGRRPPGKIDFKGRLGLDPRQAEGQLAVDDLPLQVFEPYFGEALNIDLRRADASFKGQVAYRQTAAGPVAQVGGDFALEDFRASTLAPSEELLAWKALSLRGLQVALEPAKATRVDIKDTVVTDFFARVIVMPDGRINLQDLVKPSGQRPVAAPAPGGAPETIAASPSSIRAGGQNDAQIRQEKASAQGRLPAIVNVGPMRLLNGKVLFSDRFVKPNYSANLSELNGQLGAFSSVPAAGAAPTMADLALRGRAEGTASLEILGKLNPLAKPLALDIQGKVRDLELPPLSPYSVKYAGYGINRGKLSVDVAYVVQPNGQLTASNKIVLNQLSFGDKAEGSTVSLPVKLAVALLADRNGVIDIDLPVSGSLNDPQFSLGSVIVKAIANLIVKAVTAPFSLLANAFGGSSEELGSVPFPAGSARLAPDARSGLDKVAQALQERSGLRLTVVGTSSLALEAEGYRRERLDEMVRAQKRRVVARDGGDTAAVSVSPAEYPALLAAVYRRTDMAKPRNLVGLAKDLPVPEMEKLLMAGIPANEDAMRELALQRGVAVKDYLASRGLPMERLFLGATRAAPADPKWTPSAELNLAMP